MGAPLGFPEQPSARLLEDVADLRFRWGFGVCRDDQGLEGELSAK